MTYHNISEDIRSTSEVSHTVTMIRELFIFPWLDTFHARCPVSPVGTPRRVENVRGAWAAPHALGRGTEAAAPGDVNQTTTREHLWI